MPGKTNDYVIAIGAIWEPKNRSYSFTMLNSTKLISSTDDVRQQLNI